MTHIVKSTILAVALVAASATFAAAQSIATAPPNDSGQDARSMPYGSTQSFFPKPGGSAVIPQDNPAPATQPTAAASGAYQPYPGQPYSGQPYPKPN
jgi:hypothetical protein